MTATPDFPGILGEIAEVAGAAAALRIAHEKGGTRVSIPARPKDGHWLVEAVGREAAERICDHFRTLSPEGREGGVRDVVMPLGPNGTMARAKRQVAVALAEGASVREAARRSGVHERTAWRIKAEVSRDDGQGDLF